MPKCVVCGAEQPRSEMFGTEEDLRCGVCAQKVRQRYTRPTVRLGQRIAPVTIGILIVAGLASISKWFFPGSVNFLIDDSLSIWEGEVWRFFTSIFPHGSIFHLGFNLYWTWKFGSELEMRVGSLRFFGLLMITAIGPLATNFLVSPGPAIGLSGVVYGLFGYLYALRLHRDYAAEQIQPQIVQLFIVWFFICLFFLGGTVANTAHGAGAIFGWLTGRALLQHKYKILRLAGVGLLTFVTMLAPLHMPWNQEYLQFRAIQAWKLNHEVILEME